MKERFLLTTSESLAIKALLAGLCLAVFSIHCLAQSNLLLKPKAVYIHSESVFSGIDFRNDTFDDVLRKLGKPSHIEISSPQTKFRVVFVTRTYEWQGRTSWLKITAGNRNTTPPRITRLEVWGKHPDAEIGTTGHGISLGDSISEVRRRYGLRLYFGVTLSEADRFERQANQCGYAPTLAVEFDEDDRVSHMELSLTNCPTF